AAVGGRAGRGDPRRLDRNDEPLNAYLTSTGRRAGRGAPRRRGASTMAPPVRWPAFRSASRTSSTSPACRRWRGRVRLPPSMPQPAPGATGRPPRDQAGGGRPATSPTRFIWVFAIQHGAGSFAVSAVTRGCQEYPEHVVGEVTESVRKPANLLDDQV